MPMWQQAIIIFVGSCFVVWLQEKLHPSKWYKGKGEGWTQLGASLVMLLMLACFLAYGAWVVWMIANGKVTYVIAL